MKYQALSKEQDASLRLELEKIKKEVTRIQHSIEIRKTLTDLRTDERYKKVFDEYYLKDEVVRTTMLLTEKYFMEDNQRMSLQDSLIGMAHFNDWVNATMTMGSLSAGRLVEHHNRVQAINDMLNKGVVLVDGQLPVPPEGVPNV